LFPWPSPGGDTREFYFIRRGLKNEIRSTLYFKNKTMVFLKMPARVLAVVIRSWASKEERVKVGEAYRGVTTFCESIMRPLINAGTFLWFKVDRAP
jgi:hypothetical protein